MQQFIAKIAKGQKTSKDLTWEEAKQAMRLLIEGAASPEQIGGFLVAMRLKTESVTELAAFTAQARHYIPPIPDVAGLPIVDVPSYAGKQETFHVIVPAAMVAAAAGAMILMHGSKGPEDRSGVSPVLRTLGVPTELIPTEIGRELRDRNFAYLDLALYHPPVNRLLELRQQLGVRNLFHPVARLLSPARAESQVIGLSHPPYFEKTVEALRMLGCRRALVIRGIEGDPELSIASVTKMLELRDERSGAAMQTSATDISGRGCYVETLMPIPFGTAVRISFWMDTEKITTAGVVRASDPGVGMGIEFTGLDFSTQERFQHLLEKLDPGSGFAGMPRA